MIARTPNTSTHRQATGGLCGVSRYRGARRVLAMGQWQGNGSGDGSRGARRSKNQSSDTRQGAAMSSCEVISQGQALSFASGLIPVDPARWRPRMR
jgi:hypothetical protein